MDPLLLDELGAASTASRMAAFYELLVAPLAFVLCARHARHALGAGRAAGELTALVLYGFALEGTAMCVFATRAYGPDWRVRPMGVPLALALFRASLILSSLALAARASLRSPLSRAAGATFTGLAVDLLMEPVAAAAGLWRWMPAGSWLGVPVGHFAGLAVGMGVYAWGAEAFSGRGTPARQVLRRALVAIGGLGAALGAGFLWRGAQLEGSLPASAGWFVWGAVLAPTLAVGLRGRWSAVGTSLGSSLGAVPGHGPGLALLVTAGALGTHAALIGSSPLRTAALGPLLVVLVVAGGDIHRAAVVSWRDRMHGRLSGVEGLVAVLMKRRNGTPWSREEREFLQAELRSMTRYLPALLLLLLPGSVVLLPIYAWLLDRRRGARRGEAARRRVAAARERTV